MSDLAAQTPIGERMIYQGVPLLRLPVAWLAVRVVTADMSKRLRFNPKEMLLLTPDMSLGLGSKFLLRADAEVCLDHLGANFADVLTQGLLPLPEVKQLRRSYDGDPF